MPRKEAGPESWKEAGLDRARGVAGTEEEGGPGQGEEAWPRPREEEGLGKTRGVT